jgi:hypothetical protein
MTDERFDKLTKQVSSSATRRGLLKGAAAVALGSLAARVRGGGNAEARTRIRMACARTGQACSSEAGAPGNLRCCPHLICDSDTSICRPTDVHCALGIPAESCADSVASSCGPEDFCAQVTNVDGGCACIIRTCGLPCSTGADCQSGMCVDVPGCCGPAGAFFCATPCGAQGPAATTSDARERDLGSWQR